MHRKTPQSLMRFPHVGIPGEARALRPWRIRPTPRRYCRPTPGNTRLGPALSALADTRRFFFISIRHPRFYISILFYTSISYLFYPIRQCYTHSILHFNVISIIYQYHIYSVLTSYLFYYTYQHYIYHDFTFLFNLRTKCVPSDSGQQCRNAPKTSRRRED